MKSLFLFLCLAIANNVFAHELSTAYVSANIRADAKLIGSVKVDVLNIKEALTLDINHNGELTWAELKNNQSKIETYVRTHLQFARNEDSCPISFNESMALQNINASIYLVLPFSAQCNVSGDLKVDYSMLFGLLANHKAIISIKSEQSEQIMVIDSANKGTSFDLNNSNRLQAFGAFVYQGIFHIVIGLDHVLFLLTLLLTVCLTRQQGKWQAISSKSQIIKRTFWMVTSFTIAHSITLSGTALAWLPTMGSWIEVVIAASILFNVINNLFPLIRNLSLITFIFGLIHGMGFAGALAELGLPEDAKLLTVLAFNLGVEIGQLGIIVLTLPLLLLGRGFLSYRSVWMPLMSVSIGLLAIYWIIERTFI